MNAETKRYIEREILHRADVFDRMSMDRAEGQLADAKAEMERVLSWGDASAEEIEAVQDNITHWEAAIAYKKGEYLPDAEIAEYIETEIKSPDREGAFDRMDIGRAIESLKRAWSDIVEMAKEALPDDEMDDAREDVLHWTAAVRYIESR